MVQQVVRQMVHETCSRYSATYGKDEEQYSASMIPVQFLQFPNWQLLSGPPHPPHQQQQW